VSALGIEEQRVRVTVDFVDLPETWSQLGHDYRVIVHLAIWSADDALQKSVRRKTIRVPPTHRSSLRFEPGPADP
jgi:hypothetical protein